MQPWLQSGITFRDGDPSKHVAFAPVSLRGLAGFVDVGMRSVGRSSPLCGAVAGVCNVRRDAPDTRGNTIVTFEPEIIDASSGLD